MANSREVLLKLVRLAMGWESDYSLPEDINWVEVLEESSEQGVAAIMLDGYDKLIQKNPISNGGLTTSNNKALLLQAIGQVPLIESSNKMHLEALKELGSLLQKAGVPFLLMKGFSCGQYYPIPYHRPCGDIDIYPGEWFEKSNNALKEAGIGVEKHYYRHSVSFVHDVMVENHLVLCDLRGPNKQTRDLEKQLKSEAEWSFYSGKQAVVNGEAIPGGIFPTADFNALFLPWHVSSHFAFERVTLRHLLDWALFLTHDGKNINVEKFSEAKAKYTFGYSKFADILTVLALKYLNMSVDEIPDPIIKEALRIDDALALKVLDYMFVGQPRERDKNVWIFRWNNAKRVLQERWKYKELYNESAFRFLTRKAWDAVFHYGE